MKHNEWIINNTDASHAAVIHRIQHFYLELMRDFPYNSRVKKKKEKKDERNSIFFFNTQEWRVNSREILIQQRQHIMVTSVVLFILELSSGGTKWAPVFDFHSSCWPCLFWGRDEGGGEGGEEGRERRKGNKAEALEGEEEKE